MAVRTIHKTNSQRIIKFGNSRFKIINLTEPLREDTEVFPGDSKPDKKAFCSFEKEDCQHNIYSVGDHNYRPHGDTPSHYNPQYKK